MLLMVLPLLNLPEVRNRHRFGNVTATIALREMFSYQRSEVILAAILER